MNSQAEIRAFPAWHREKGGRLVHLSKPAQLIDFRWRIAPSLPDYAYFFLAIGLSHAMLKGRAQ